MKQFDWEKLQCRYFSQVCEEVLNDLFNKNGFLPSLNKVGGIRYIKNDIFIDIKYFIETAPDYSLAIEIGEIHGEITNSFPLWFLLENIDSISYSVDYSLWKFNSKKKLKEVLLKVKEKIIETLVLDKMTKGDIRYFIIEFTKTVSI